MPKQKKKVDLYKGGDNLTVSKTIKNWQEHKPKHKPVYDIDYIRSNKSATMQGHRAVRIAHHSESLYGKAYRPAVEDQAEESAQPYGKPTLSRPKTPTKDILSHAFAPQFDKKKKQHNTKFF